MKRSVRVSRIAGSPNAPLRPMGALAGARSTSVASCTVVQGSKDKPREKALRGSKMPSSLTIQTGRPRDIPTAIPHAPRANRMPTKQIVARTMKGKSTKARRMHIAEAAEDPINTFTHAHFDLRTSNSVAISHPLFCCFLQTPHTSISLISSRSM